MHRWRSRLGAQRESPKAPFAYRLVDHQDPSREITFQQPVSRDKLIKLDMPELELGPWPQTIRSSPSPSQPPFFEGPELESRR